MKSFASRSESATAPSGSSEGANGLRVDGISLRFGGVSALDDVSLHVDVGQTVGLIGPNGAGKSTLVNCVVGLYRPQKGHISLNGRRIDTVPAHALARMGISRTFQNLRLVPSLSVLENVMIGAHSRTRSGASSAILRLPNQRVEEARLTEQSIELLRRFGMAALAHRPVGSLPYAQQKAAEICRALAAQPTMLLLDEPAAGMSSDEREETAALIRSLSGKSIGILLIEHDVPMVMETCDRVAVLDHGSILAEGTPESVQADSAVIQAYLGDDS